MSRSTFALLFIGPLFALIVWDTVRYYGGAFIARRRRLELDRQIEESLALCDPSAPIFAETLADMPDAAKPMGAGDWALWDAEVEE